MKQLYLLIFSLFSFVGAMAQSGNVEELIDFQPEGEMKIYTRSGVAFFENDAYKAEKGTQDGELMTMIYAPDGTTVYMKDPISKYKQDTWVKGTIEGNTITVALGQNLKYQGVLNDTYMKIGMFNLYDYTAYGVGYVAELDQTVTEVTYTIEGNKIRLNDTDETRMLGVYWADDRSWDHYGDIESVYTQLGTSEMNPVPVDPFVPVFFLPEGQFKPEVNFRITFKDIYGQETLAENYTFCVFLKERDKEAKQYVFDSEIYLFDQDMVYFPLDFQDPGKPEHFGYDPNKDAFWLTFEDFTEEWEAVGIQLINTVDGTAYNSNVVYVEVPSSDINAISNVETGDMTPEYYDLQGRKIEKPHNGIYIMRLNGKSKKVQLSK